MKRLAVLVLVGFAMVFGAGVLHAEALTPELAKQKVEEAAAMITAEGDLAIPKIKEMRFAGGEGYIWIHNLAGKMIMHPMKPALDGTDVLGMTDPNGVALFGAMNEVVEKSGSGWVPYMWPKPNQTNASPKVSYVKLVKAGGKDYVVGCGLYDVTGPDIKAKFASDAVYEG